MEQNVTKKLPLRLLLNAEPFGFGPTAAIAGFFPHLRPHFDKVGYVGKKHTLDLQKGLPYDAIHDVSGIPKEERADALKSVFSQYDVLFTAMDHKVAEEAQKAGLKVFYYDALAWYWPEIPESVCNSDLYLAQDFFGVEERLKDVFARHTAAYAVPPIAPESGISKSKDHVLINLGGLQNPYWPVEDVILYARSVVAALRKAIPADQKIVIAASHAVAEQMKDDGVRTFPRKEMEDILARSSVAFMTPGLGNIYDAAAYNLPTAWLPPANDSQGQQLDLIERNRMSDGAIDWGAVVPGEAIDYRGEQISALSNIARVATHLAQDAKAQERLTQRATELYRDLITCEGSRIAAIMARFGTGGEKKVAEIVVEKARSYVPGPGNG